FYRHFAARQRVSRRYRLVTYPFLYLSLVAPLRSHAPSAVRRPDFASPFTTLRAYACRAFYLCRLPFPRLRWSSSSPLLSLLYLLLRLCSWVVLQFIAALGALIFLLSAAALFTL